jgi:hypothetical protein
VRFSPVFGGRDRASGTFPARVLPAGVLLGRDLVAEVLVAGDLVAGDLVAGALVAGDLVAGDLAVLFLAVRFLVAEVTAVRVLAAPVLVFSVLDGFVRDLFEALASGAFVLVVIPDNLSLAVVGPRPQTAQIGLAQNLARIAMQGNPVPTPACQRRVAGPAPRCIHKAQRPQRPRRDSVVGTIGLPSINRILSAPQ